MASNPTPGYSGLRGRELPAAYNEAAFRHFLAVDRRRAQRSTRSLVLVLVTVRRSDGRCARFTDATADVLFGILSACVREVDVVGWYREGYVIAAVLPQGTDALPSTPRLVTQRLLPALRQPLPPHQWPNLRIRAVRLGGRTPLERSS
jgi:hypothetical protein